MNYLYAICTFMIIVSVLTGAFVFIIYFPAYFFGGMIGFFVVLFIHMLKLTYDEIYGRR